MIEIMEAYNNWGVVLLLDHYGNQSLHGGNLAFNIRAGLVQGSSDVCLMCQTLSSDMVTIPNISFPWL
jgi:hypothetical protein